MKFFCEYCGNMIDAQEDKKCPNCGASYKRNKNFIKLHEEKNKEEQQTKEFKQQIMNHTLGAMKVSKWIVFIPIIIFLIVLSIIIFSFININKNISNQSSDIKNGVDSIFDSVKDQLESKEEPKKITVNFNEFGETSEYKFKVTKYEVVEDKYNNVEENYELIKFHFVVENISGKQLTKEDVNCIVDGIAQNNDFTSGYSDLPMFIQKDLTVKGTSSFEVPKDADSYNVKYGDYITVHIEK